VVVIRGQSYNFSHKKCPRPRLKMKLACRGNFSVPPGSAFYVLLQSVNLQQATLWLPLISLVSYLAGFPSTIRSFTVSFSCFSRFQPSEVLIQKSFTCEPLRT